MNTMLRAAVYGAAIGDALGVPFEFNERGTFECVDMIGFGTHRQPAGTWSDDTSMLIATCDSIRAHKGRIHTDDLRKRYLSWYRSGAYTPDGRTFDVGNTVATALEEGAGRTGEHSNGNGSLMRIIPLAFTDASDEEIAAASAVTHAHRISVEACIMYVHIARMLAEGSSIEDAIEACVEDQPPFERLRGIAAIPQDEISGSGYVLHTLEAALWCLSTTDSYEACVRAAVNLGSDTDTTACVAGGLAGIVYGIDAIPASWMETLRAKDEIERCLF